MSTSTRDWVAWHDQYQDGSSDLSRRLRVVQTEIRRALATTPAGPFRAVSVCAGQGHDLIGVLADHPDSHRVTARLVEVSAENVATMRARAERAGLDLEIVEGDAADTASYAGAVPADLVLAVGIFGNISDEDVFATIRSLPQFCAPGATVLWSRGQQLRDITDHIRHAFTQAGFEETAFHKPADAMFQIGAARYQGPPQQLQPAHLFTFVK
ncbi:MAG TPA: class I SAM-dependent methyltransferase [Solirubrobacteraceae bacterium]|nr:class I SAM-dependent methyltransferase [Solirubrobacteraceae bacterium]